MRGAEAALVGIHWCMSSRCVLLLLELKGLGRGLVLLGAAGLSFILCCRFGRELVACFGGWWIKSWCVLVCEGGLQYGGASISRGVRVGAVCILDDLLTREEVSVGSFLPVCSFIAILFDLLVSILSRGISFGVKGIARAERVGFFLSWEGLTMRLGT